MARYYIDYEPRGYTKPKHTVLAEMFGEAVKDIKRDFLLLDDEDLECLLEEYGEKYGASAASYARRIYPKWKRGTVELSGKTMERLIDLVPPYLSSSERYELLMKVLKLHKQTTIRQVRINLYEPDEGFRELNTVLSNLNATDQLAYLPAKVIQAATWLYNNDMTAARAMLAQADRIENNIVRTSAFEEIKQLQRLIRSGKVDEASYVVNMPGGRLMVETYTPFFHLKTFLPKSIARFI
jgi:hypothetical protein